MRVVVDWMMLNVVATECTRYTFFVCDRDCDDAQTAHTKHFPPGQTHDTGLC